ncbi:hypothetical protein [Streptomyces sp. S.PB5]|uniref:hypothetical protein n=1 Tax=Streptomyces sp. S.PB5 TaxID=3020844 RepID=UPI0025AFB6B4|nr:hypothetical protein [Streptomyces sp. S.PB5]MDN3028661.1 hypothetical protein [Streptomyces sp. S.PB5]
MEDRSAQEILDEANDTMGALSSVTVEAGSDKSDGTGISSRFTSDLDSKCVSKVTWEKTGAVLEQIRIGETDYVRPNRAYIDNWSGKTVDAPQSTWFRTPTSKARSGDGLVTCTRDFASFGTAKKGKATEVDGTGAIELVVTDEADEGGTYTFSVATEGKPYILKVVYKGAGLSTTTTYSAFDEPLDIRPPAEANVVDAPDSP